MRILREAYTKDELKQHVSDTRNIISALQDSLAILQSSFSDPDDSLDKEECSKLARYARGYEIDIDDMMKDFYDDFEKFIVDEPEEDEVEDDYEYEEDTEIEESLNEDLFEESFDDFYSHYKNKIKSWSTMSNADDIYQWLVDDLKDLESKSKLHNWKWDFSKGVENIAKKLVEKAKEDFEWLDESLNEDTVKTSDGKWTNKGDTGETHGKFKTKKEADAQRKAMFANGYKG